MPSEKSDLCRESDCVFEPLLLSLAVRGKRVSERMGGDGVGASWRGAEVCPDWWSVQVGGITQGGSTSIPQPTLNTRQIKRVCAFLQTVDEVYS